MLNLFKKKYIVILAAVMALSFSVFFVGCHSSLNEESDHTQTEEPGEKEDPVDPSTQALGEAVFKLVVKGAEGDLNLSYGDISLNANVRASLDGTVLAFIDTEIFDVPAKIGLQFENGNKNVLAEIAGEKFYFDLTDTAEVAERISAVLEGRDPVVPDIENGETYPPVVIAGLDLDAIFSLLNDFDGTSILGLLTETVGVKTENGYEYNVKLTESIGISMFVDNENNLKNLAVTGLELGGTEAKAELFVRYPEEPVVPVSTEDYINVKTYLPIIENFCKDKVESVPQLIETIKNLNLSEIANILRGVKECKTISFDLSLSSPVGVSAAAIVDFNDGLKAKLSLSALGVDADVYFDNGEIYLSVGAVKVKCSAEDIGDMLKIFGVSFEIPELDGLLSANLKETVVKLAAFVNGSGIEIENISASGDVIKIVLSGAEINFNVKDFTLGASFEGADLQIANISAGEKITVPQENYSELSCIMPVVKNLYDAVKGGKLLLGGTLDVGGTVVALENVKADIAAFAFAGGVKIGDISFNATYIEDYLYADLAGIAQVKLDKASMEKTLGDVMGALGGLNTAFTFDAGKLLATVKSLTADETGVRVSLDLSEFGFGTAEIALAANGESTDVALNMAGIKAELSVGTYAGEIVAPQKYGDISDFIKAVNVKELVSLVETIMEKKALSAAVELSMTGLSAKGAVLLDFADGLKLGLKANIGGNEVEVYYENGNIYLLKSGVALKATAEDIEALTALFGAELTLPDISGIKLDEIYAENGALKIRFGEISAEIDGASLNAKLSCGDIAVSLANISAGEKVAVPQITWSDLSDALPVVENLYGKISSMTFGFSGTLDAAKKVTFTDVRVIDSGTNGIKQDFEDGKLSIAGRVTVDDGYIHNIDVVYTENRLYVSYNDTMKLTMGKTSLDNIVKLVKDNLDFILDGFIKSEAISDLFNSKDYGKFLSVLSLLDIQKDKVDLTLDLSSLGSESLSLSLAQNEDKTLSLSVNAANLVMDAALTDVSEEIAAPADAANYIDVSNIEYLLEGFLVTATKESKTFVMRGSVDLAINLFGINQTITVGLEANVRINADNSVDAYVVWDNSKPQKILGTYVLTGTIHDQAIKFGKTVVTLKDDILYIDRMDMKKKTFLGATTGFENGDYEHKKIATADCSGETLTNLIFYIFGLQPSLLESGSGSSGGSVQYEKIFKNYESLSPFEHKLVVATSVLAGSDMLGDLTADIVLDENKNITDVTAALVIDFVVGNISPTVKAKHYVNETYDFTAAFEAINNNQYSDFVV